MRKKFKCLKASHPQPPYYTLIGNYYFSPEFAKIEAFLDENPEFFQNYLIRKATRSMIDAWLVSYAIPPGTTSLPPYFPPLDESKESSAHR